MLRLPRTTALVAAVGGALWTVKALVITARDGSFDPLESYVFIGGLLGLLSAAVLIGAHLTRRVRGPGRIAAAAGAALGVVAATLVLESIGKAVVGGLAAGDNLGLEQEGGILCCGLAWLALGGAVLAGRRRAGAATVSA